MKKTLKLLASIAIGSIPFIVSAQNNRVYITGLSGQGQPQTLATLINDSVVYINGALYVLMAVAIVVFVIYIIKYFILPNENRKDAGLYVMYSVIGFFVILSIWGLVNILSNTFNTGNSTAPTYQQLKNLFPAGVPAGTVPSGGGSGGGATSG